MTDLSRIWRISGKMTDSDRIWLRSGEKWQILAGFGGILVKTGRIRQDLAGFW